MVAIFVVLTIVVFLTVDYFVLRAQRKRVPQGEVAPGVGLIPVPIDETLLPRRPLYPLHEKGFTLPGGLFFDRGHTWVRVRSSGDVRIGIDDFAQTLIGRIDGVEMPPIGLSVKRGDPLIKVKQGKRTATFVSPVEGKVTGVNGWVSQNPEILKQNPYKLNWLVTVKPAQLSASVKTLLIAEEAVQWLREELHRFRDFISRAAPQVALVGETLQDGGQPVDGLLERVNGDIWEGFQREFLHA